MKDSDYITATNLANLRGALHLLGNYMHTGDGSDKVRRAYRAIAETEIELSEALLASGDDEPESEPSGDQSDPRT